MLAGPLSLDLDLSKKRTSHVDHSRCSCWLGKSQYYTSQVQASNVPNRVIPTRNGKALAKNVPGELKPFHGEPECEKSSISRLF